MVGPAVAAARSGCARFRPVVAAPAAVRGLPATGRGMPAAVLALVLPALLLLRRRLSKT